MPGDDPGFRHRAANTLLLIVILTVTILNGAETGSIEAPLRLAVIAAGVLVVLLAIREIWRGADV